MKLKFLLCIVLAMTASNILFAQEPGAGEKPKDAKKAENIKPTDKLTAKDYEEMLVKLKGGDTTIDFVKFRLAYTETESYSPYGGGDVRGQMMKALGEEKFKDALKSAEKMLETNYCDLHAHFTASAAYRKLEKSKEADFHKAVFKGLMDAILINDGLTAKTAMISIGISEQYFIMSYLGFERQSKALVQDNGSVFDVHTSYNSDTKETRKFYFNIDKVFGRF